MEKACGPAFADSYLSGAEEERDGLMPLTVTAWERLSQNGKALRVLRELGITLRRPLLPNNAQSAVSDAEFDQMSLQDKIRQHRFLADQAFMKAGPMWRNGKPLNASDMPQSWHALIDKAKGHMRESKRLSDLIKAPMKMAAE